MALFEPRELGAQRVPNGLKVEWDGLKVSEHRSRPAPSRLFAEFALSRKGIVLELWLFADSARRQGTGEITIYPDGPMLLQRCGDDCAAERRSVGAAQRDRCADVGPAP